MATNTYVALDKATVTGSAVPSITFTGISGSYTDLVIVCNWTISSGSSNFLLTFNGDSTSGLYSKTQIEGVGSNPALTGATANANNIGLESNIATSTTIPSVQIINVMNYSSTSVFKTVMARQAGWLSGAAGTSARMGLWRNTNAITSITLTGGGTNIAVGSTFSLYGIAAESATPAPKATGGVISSDSTYYYHSFFSTGIFTPLQALTADVLVVAGGGASGSRLAGEANCAGGGAGGLRNIASQSLSNGINYTCTIGSGGAASGATNLGARGGSGNTSSFSGSGFTTINASGGGGGGAQTNLNGANLSIQQGGTGGSGGGSAFDGSGNNAAAGAAGNAGSYSPVEGFAGGGGGSAPIYYIGGGGGAGGVGVGGSSGNTGGPGITYSNGITYAKGGDAQSNTGPGVIATGNGGNGFGGGNAGGSGIVIVRYLKA
jgi:hypothetical protein